MSTIEVKPIVYVIINLKIIILGSVVQLKVTIGVEVKLRVVSSMEVSA